MVDQKRLVLTRLLAERSQLLPRPARQFLEHLLRDDPLLERMSFCRCEERAGLRNSVLIATQDGHCWGVLLGNDPESGRGPSRARLALEGLDLSPAELVEQLRTLPIWFLAVDPEYASPAAGTAAHLETTVHRLAALPAERIRRTALLDQIDAALDAGDREAYERLRALLNQLAS